MINMDDNTKRTYKQCDGDHPSMPWSERNNSGYGLTKREHMATLILSGLVTNLTDSKYTRSAWQRSEVVKESVLLANMLIDALNDPTI